MEFAVFMKVGKTVGEDGGDNDFVAGEFTV